MIKVIELFAGYGSQSLALENLGIPHEVVAISEIDKYALQAYSQLHEGKCPNLGDITKIIELEHCDLLTYSFPCTSVSGAGKQEGLEEGSGTASSLLWECRRLIQSSKPKYLLMENVKALTSKKFKPYFDKWLDELEGMGYKNHWKIINAKEYLPQNRERVFCVSIRNDIENNFNFDNVKNQNEMTLRLKDMLESEVDEKYYLKETVNFNLRNQDISYCIDANYHKGTNVKQFQEKGRRQIIQVDMLDIKGNEQVRRVCSDEGLSPTLNTMQDGNRQPKVLQEVINPLKDKTNYGWHFEQQVYDINEITRTIKAGGGSGNIPKTIIDFRIRKLTPKECLRLMGLRDDQIDKMKGISNSQLYKMAGNSIVIPVLEAIFKELFKKLD